METCENCHSDDTVRVKLVAVDDEEVVVTGLYCNSCGIFTDEDE